MYCPARVYLVLCSFSKVTYCWGKTKFTVHAWFWIGSALILCLSTISVILQPLLSKFSFLINLVSRNGSFIFSHLICVSWQMFLLFLFGSLVPLTITAIIIIFLVSTSLSYKMFTRVLSLQRWWNGFHQLTTFFGHDNATIFLISSFIYVPILFEVILILILSTVRPLWVQHQCFCCDNFSLVHLFIGLVARCMTWMFRIISDSHLIAKARELTQGFCFDMFYLPIHCAC